MPTPRAFEWAFGLASKETTFGTAQSDGSMIDWLSVTEADFAQLDVTYRTDENEINGFVGVTEHQEESRQAKVARKANASVEFIAWAIAMFFGNVTASGSTPNYTHTAKWRSICTVNGPSFSFVEGLICTGATGTYWLYKGCVINQITIEVNGKGAVVLTLDIWTDGTETAKTTFTFPTAVNSVNKLIGSMLTLKCGAAGTEDLSSLTRNYKVTLNAGIVIPPSISASTAIAEYQFGGNAPTMDVEFTIKADKSHAIYTAYQNKTAQILDALLQFNSNRSIRLHCSQGIVMATEKPQGNETQLTVKYVAEHNATDSGAGVWTLKTGVSSYLNAA